MLEAKVQVHQHQKYKVTTDSNHQPTALDNLLNREFNISPSDHVYTASGHGLIMAGSSRDYREWA